MTWTQLPALPCAGAASGTTGAPVCMYYLGTIDPDKYAASKKEGGKPLAGAHNDGYAPLPGPSIKIGVRTMSPLAAGSAVQIKFRLPSGTADIEATGRVAWSNRQVGMGIQFDRVETTAQLAIDAFVDANT